MFCPPDSPAIPQARVMQDNFDAAKRVESFIVTADGEDMLQQANLLRDGGDGAARDDADGGGCRHTT